MRKLIILLTASVFFWACSSIEPDKSGSEQKTAAGTETAKAVVSGTLKVQTYQSGPVVQNQVYEKITLVNTGIASIALTSIKVRYYFAYQGVSSYNFACDYTAIGTTYVKGIFNPLSPVSTGADGYNEISFTGPAGGVLAAGSSLELQCRIYKSDWSNMDNSKNYSYNASTSLTDDSKVTAYLDGALVWGMEPGATSSSVTTSSLSSSQPVSSSSSSSSIPVSSSVKTSSISSSSSSSSAAISSSSSSSQPSSSSAGVTTGALKIQTEQNGSVIQNQLNERILIVNTGKSALSLANMKIHYYFTYQGTTSYGFSCDYSAIGAANVKGIFAAFIPGMPGADAYNEISFTASAGSLSAGASVELQCRIWKTDWSNIDSSKNYSYNPLTVYSDCMVVTAYINGVIAWGYEPEGTISTSSSSSISSVITTSSSSSVSSVATSSSSTGSVSSDDRQFPGVTDKDTLISLSRQMNVVDVKTMIRRIVDENFTVISNWLGLDTREKAYALFYGDATRESVGNDPDLKFMANLETAIAPWGQNSAHAYGPIQTAETAYDCVDLWPQTQETNVTGMKFYTLEKMVNGSEVIYPEVFYDPGISFYMGVHKFIHFAIYCKLGQYPAAQVYTGADIARHTLAAFNTGWPEADANELTTYSDEVGAAAKFYLTQGHLYDSVVTYTGDPQLDRTNPWSWF